MKLTSLIMVAVAATFATLSTGHGANHQRPRPRPRPEQCERVCARLVESVPTFGLYNTSAAPATELLTTVSIPSAADGGLANTGDFATIEVYCYAQGNASSVKQFGFGVEGMLNINGTASGTDVNRFYRIKVLRATNASVWLIAQEYLDNTARQLTVTDVVLAGPASCDSGFGVPLWVTLSGTAINPADFVINYHSTTVSPSLNPAPAP